MVGASVVAMLLLAGAVGYRQSVALAHEPVDPPMPPGATAAAGSLFTDTLSVLPPALPTIEPTATAAWPQGGASVSAEFSASAAPNVIGGADAAPGAWPFVVQVLIDGQRACGGALIDQRFVLTAAHCVTDESAFGGINFLAPAQVSVRVGDHNTLLVDGFEQERLVRQVIAHDIALLQLQRPVRLSGRVATIGLPPAIPPEEAAARLPEEQASAPAMVIGWGDTQTESSSPAVVLQQAEAPLLEAESCRSVYGPGRISEEMLCTGTTVTGASPCFGDSGGPLVAHRAATPMLLGVVSHGYQCGATGAPSVFTRVASYVPWIRSYVETGDNHSLEGGSFETSRERWWLTSEFSAAPVLTSTLPIAASSGNWALWMGDRAGPGTGAAAETGAGVTQFASLMLPVSLHAEALHFRFQIRSDEPTCGMDTARVWVSGRVVALFDLCGNTLSWLDHAIDMRALRGETVWVVFGVRTNGSGPSRFLVDDLNMSFVHDQYAGLTHVSPAAGAPGSDVTIHGGHFLETVQVTLGGRPLPFEVIDDSTIFATILPTSTSGSVQVHMADTVEESVLPFAVLRPVTVTVAGRAADRNGLATVGEQVVSSEPDGLRCVAGACSGLFAEGQTVLLWPHADPERIFAGWEGACAGQGVPCRLAMGSGAPTLPPSTALFAEIRARVLLPLARR
ncbi:MAG: serine protease [Caldilineaceae bacterium]